MTERISSGTAGRRRGVAAMWAIIVLTILAVVMALTVRQSVTAVRLVDRRQHQLQATWLARSGIELAAGKLLAAPDGYSGETLELVPGGRVRITVQTKEDMPGVFWVTSDARYPVEEVAVVMRSTSQVVRRVMEKDRVRLAAVTSNPD
jgi:hypothetical protein